MCEGNKMEDPFDKINKCKWKNVNHVFIFFQKYTDIFKEKEVTWSGNKPKSEDEISFLFVSVEGETMNLQEWQRQASLWSAERQIRW